ncbi:MAG: Ni/Fe hydrogenase subunit alpha [Verrucomicrobiia bacterium]
MKPDKKKNNKTARTIKVDYLARVEGEGGLYIRIKNGKLADVRVNIFEPPRFFEAFLRGRKYYEAPDITARICGICPVAYQMSSAHAMEWAFGTKVEGELRELRRLIYCGEWIESHVLHAFFLHTPDFLGYPSAIEMARDFKPVVEMALRLKKIGNEIVTVVGGREIHPVNPKVGGFHKAPSKEELNRLVEPLKRALDDAIEGTKVVAGFDFPEFEQDYEFVALRHPDEYPFNEGHIVSNYGLDIPVNEYENNFIEEHVKHSTALHSIRKGRGNYFVGPLARFNLNYDRLSPAAREAARLANLKPVCKNPFKSVVVRAIETVYAIEEALRIIKQYEPPEKPCVEIAPKAGVGYGCTEAPRGILYHRYRINSDGIILDARIVPPTAQNLKTMESDLRAFVPPRLKLSDERLGYLCEQAIRNYDPCISCSAHFLKLKIERE